MALHICTNIRILVSSDITIELASKKEVNVCYFNDKLINTGIP